MSTESTHVAIDGTYGAVYIGSVLAMGLWGSLTVQTYYYFNEYPNDPWLLTILVTTVWILDTIHQAFTTHATYSYLVTNYGNPLFLDVIMWSLKGMIFVSGCVCILIASFLIYRVWHLSEKNIILTGVLSALALAQFVSNTYLRTSQGYFVLISRLSSFTEVQTITWLSKIVNSLSGATDVCIALTLIYLLHRSRTHFKRSETMINRLIIFTINTGALTSIVALLAVLFVSIYPDRFIYVAFYVCISRMYTNTLLATLNARKRARAGLSVSCNQESAIVYTGTEDADAQNRVTNKFRNTRTVAIRVETETMHDNIDLEDLKTGGAHGVDDSDHSHSYDKANLNRV